MTHVWISTSAKTKSAEKMHNVSIPWEVLIADVVMAMLEIHLKAAPKMKDRAEKTYALLSSADQMLFVISDNAYVLKDSKEKIHMT